MSAWNLLTRLSRPFQPRSTLSGRDLQLHLDTATLFRILPPRRNQPHQPPPTPEQQHIAELLNLDAPLPPFEQQATTLTAHLHAGTTRALRALLSSLRTPRPSDALREALSFSLSVNPSSIPGAGRGIFVDGTVNAGNIVTLYPGVSYLPSQVRCAGIATANLNATAQAEYYISRYDGVVIDGSAELEVDLTDVLPKSRRDELDECDLMWNDKMVHPLGLGHVVNHPPKGGTPNVLQFMLDLDISAWSRELRLLAPCRSCDLVGGLMEKVENEAFRQRVPSSAAFVSAVTDPWRVTRTIALVALRDIRDEEVFMNYRFNPNAPDVPDWYWDCDPKESCRRWKVKGAFY